MAAVMNPLIDALSEALRDIEACRAHFALVGGFAVSARAEPRLTRDIDLAVSVTSDREAESLVRMLVGRGFSVRALVEKDERGRIATVRLVRSQVVLDLLFTSSGIEPEIVDDAEMIDIIPNLQAPVATIGHLLALKLLARDDRKRPQDADDLRSLLAVASSRDLTVGETAVRLIAERGFHRGRDLMAAWTALLTHGPWGA